MRNAVDFHGLPLRGNLQVAVLPSSSIQERAGRESSVMTGSGIASRRCARYARHRCSCWQPAARQAPAIARSSRRAKGRVAAVVDARSLRLEDGREIRLAGIERGGTDTASGRAALVGHRRRPRRDAARRRRRAGSLWPPGRLCVRGRLGTLGAKRAAAPRRGAVFRRYRRQKLRSSAGRRRGAAREAKLGIWADTRGHKKRGKFGRYSGRRLGSLRWSRAGFCPFGRRGQRPT